VSQHSQATTASATRGTIHDQGYERYTGERRPQARRFLVISRNLVVSAWRQGWRVRLPLVGAALTAVMASGIMIVFALIGSRLHNANQAKPETIMLGALPFFAIWGFLIALSVAAPAVADDLRAGAFQFYFSRPLRAGDYVRGKLLGLFAAVGLATFFGPMLMAIVRVALANDFGEALRLIGILPRMAAVAFAATAAMVLPAAGLGALLRKRWAGMAAFASYNLIVAPLGDAFASAFHQPLFRMMSTAQCVTAASSGLLGRHSEELPAWAGWTGLAIFALAGWAIIQWRISSAERAGVGGGS
jgi:ABC-2 type transport system permease protein